MNPATNTDRGLVVDLLGRADLLDPALVHHRDPVAHRERLFLVVGHEDERDADLALDALQLELHRLAQLEVERAERLVEQQRARVVHERAGERDALLLAAGELRRLAVGEVARAGRPRAARRRASRSRPSPTFLACGPERDVVPHRHVREQRVLLEDRVDVALVRRDLRDVLALEPDLARRSAARTRRSSAASWSCRSRTGRASRRTRPRRIPKSASSTATKSPKRLVTWSIAMTTSSQRSASRSAIARLAISGRVPGACHRSARHRRCRRRCDTSRKRIPYREFTILQRNPLRSAPTRGATSWPTNPPRTEGASAMADAELHRRRVARRPERRHRRGPEPGDRRGARRGAGERRRRRRRRGRRRGRRVRRRGRATTPRERSRDAAQGRRRDRGRPRRRSSSSRCATSASPRSIIEFEMDLTVDNWRFFAGGARFLEGRAAGEYLEEHTSFRAPRPARRRRVDRAVELPAQHGDLEARARARGRQHGRAEAVGAHAAQRAAARRDHRRHPPARRAQRRDRPGRDRGRRARARIPTSRWCRSPATSRPARSSPGPRPTRSSACTSSSAARRR